MEKNERGKRYGLDTGAYSNNSFCNGCSRACMCGSVQNQRMSVRLKTAGQEQIREKRSRSW